MKKLPDLAKKIDTLLNMGKNTREENKQDAFWDELSLHEPEQQQDALLLRLAEETRQESEPQTGSEQSPAGTEESDTDIPAFIEPGSVPPPTPVQEIREKRQRSRRRQQEKQRRLADEEQRQNQEQAGLWQQAVTAEPEQELQPQPVEKRRAKAPKADRSEIPLITIQPGRGSRPTKVWLKGRRLRREGAIVLGAMALFVVLLLAFGTLHLFHNGGDPNVQLPEEYPTAQQVLAGDSIVAPQDPNSLPGGDAEPDAPLDPNTGEDNGTAIKAEQPEQEPAVDDGRPIVALTYDDGPNSTVTPRLIQALNDRGVKATFFMLGACAAANPDVVKLAADSGQLVCSHTYDHQNYLTDLSDEQLAQQINATIKAIRDACGVTPMYIRPPYGGIDQATASKIGWPLMLWTLDPRDWDYRDADKVYTEITENIFDGAVVIMHDIYETTMEATVRVVDDLQAKGWRFVTLEEYYQIKNMTPQPGHVYRGTQQSV